MLDNEKNKDFQVNHILQIIKLSSLAFSAVAFFQYLFEGVKIDTVSSTSDIIICLVLVAILAVYVLINYLQQKENGISTWLEPFVFIVISLLLVMMTGTYKSNYKFLFLFVIISSSIEFSMKIGVLISAASSIIILLIDLFLHQSL